MVFSNRKRPPGRPSAGAAWRRPRRPRSRCHPKGCLELSGIYLALLHRPTYSTSTDIHLRGKPVAQILIDFVRLTTCELLRGRVPYDYWLLGFSGCSTLQGVNPQDRHSTEACVMTSVRPYKVSMNSGFCCGGAFARPTERGSSCIGVHLAACP